MDISIEEIPQLIDRTILSIVKWKMAMEKNHNGFDKLFNMLSLIKERGEYKDISFNFNKRIFTLIFSKIYVTPETFHIFVLKNDDKKLNCILSCDISYDDKIFAQYAVNYEIPDELHLD